MRYVITEDQATWVRSFYAVNVPDGCDAGDAQEKFEEGHYEYLGFDLGSDFDHTERMLIGVERTDATPFITHPSNEPDPAQLAALVEAANSLLLDACDRGEAFPLNGDEQEDYPKDEDGNVWYPDYYNLHMALKPFYQSRP